MTETKEYGYIWKLIHALELAEAAHVGMELTVFDVIELLGLIKDLNYEVANYITEVAEFRKRIAELERAHE